MKALIVWECTSCGCQRLTLPLSDIEEGEIPSWEWINGGAVHRCETRSHGEFDGRDIYSFSSCFLKILTGEDAELWELQMLKEIEEERG